MLGKKTGGRQSGTPNRVTKELRESLKVAIAGELDRLAETLGSLPPKDRLDLLIKLMPYCLPRIESIGGLYDSGSVIDWD